MILAGLKKVPYKSPTAFVSPSDIQLRTFLGQKSEEEIEKTHQPQPKCVNTPFPLTYHNPILTFILIIPNYCALPLGEKEGVYQVAKSGSTSAVDLIVIIIGVMVSFLSTPQGQGGDKFSTYDSPYLPTPPSLQLSQPRTNFIPTSTIRSAASKGLGEGRGGVYKRLDDINPIVIMVAEQWQN